MHRRIRRIKYRKNELKAHRAALNAPSLSSDSQKTNDGKQYQLSCPYLSKSQQKKETTDKKRSLEKDFQELGRHFSTSKQAVKSRESLHYSCLYRTKEKGDWQNIHKIIQQIKRQSEHNERKQEKEQHYFHP